MEQEHSILSMFHDIGLTDLNINFGIIMCNHSFINNY